MAGILDDGLEGFLAKVDEVGDLVQDITRANDQESLTDAFDRADQYIQQQQQSSKEHPTDNEDKIKVNFNKTIINDTSPVYHSETDASFCRAMEVDAEERAKRLRERMRVGNSKRKEGNESFRREEYVKALEFYTEAIEYLPGDSLTYTNRALTYLKMGQFEEAMEDCDKAIKFKEDSLKPYLYKGKCLFMLDKENEAKDWFDSALQLFPEKQNTVKGYIKNIEGWTFH
jgi:tetratricopeptide (TPR) repeat protein